MGGSRLHSTLAERRSSFQTSATKGKTIGPNTCESSTEGGREVIVSRGNKGAAVPHMAFQHGGGKEKEQEVEGIYRLH